MNFKTAALIVAAGKGERVGGGVPKQFRKLGGRTVLAHAYDAMRAHSAVGEIAIVIGEGQREAALEALAGREAALVEGGATRQQSVCNGLDYLASSPPAHVLIHDAARPFLPTDVIDRLIAALDRYEGAIPALPVADTLVRWDGMMGDNVGRKDLYRVQTPQAFLFDVVLAAHRSWPGDIEATDDSQIVRDTGHEVTIVEGHRMLEKLTTQGDFDVMERLLAPNDIRTGMGYDVHRLEEGEELWLCGVKVPHSHGLAGHSDADVALHALVDALLGALADGDIGQHFPPSDMQWKGAASSRFVEYTRDRVAARGGVIRHVDLTLICEAPKVGPHRDVMRARVAELLAIPEGRVSIKATTTEKLGFAGRREGIAAQAIATIALPVQD
jgi:2-C-methyl-D-erythritol 4-phosphate cytidylyltransferase/2-C-methyl-D-erythritol 2,4-cyclodiphosphate synthase